MVFTNVKSLGNESELCALTVQQTIQQQRQIKIQNFGIVQTFQIHISIQNVVKNAQKCENIHSHGTPGTSHTTGTVIKHKRSQSQPF